MVATQSGKKFKEGKKMPAQKVGSSKPIQKGKKMPVQKLVSSTPMPKGKKNQQNKAFFDDTENPVSPIKKNNGFPLPKVKEEPDDTSYDADGSRSTIVDREESPGRVEPVRFVGLRMRRNAVSEPALTREQPPMKEETEEEDEEGENEATFESIEEIDEIFIQTRQSFDSDYHEEWVSNPYETHANFRPRNQSLDTSIQRIALGQDLNAPKRHPPRGRVQFPNVSRPLKNLRSRSNTNDQQGPSTVGPAPITLREQKRKAGPAKTQCAPIQDDDFEQVSQEEIETPPARSRKRKSNEKGGVRYKRIRETITSDEGIQSDLTDPDVKYTPQSDRYPFRTRRYRKARWIYGEEGENWRFEYTRYSREEADAEIELRKIRVKDKIDPRKLYRKNVLLMPNSIELLKVAKQLQKEKKRTAHFTSADKKKQASKMISKAFNKASGATSKKVVDNQEGYDTVTFDKFAWEQVGNGIYHFVLNNQDKYVKLSPGAILPEVNTGSNFHKYLLLSGSVGVTVNGTRQNLLGQAFINIKQNVNYEIENIGDHNAFMNLTVF